jgi:predicted extracellular nuclease
MTLSRHWRCAVIGLAMAAAGPAWSATDLAISQIYAGGGEAGSTYTHDFVEIINRSGVPVPLDGKSIQIASPIEDFVVAAALPDISLQPGQYFLLRLAGGTDGAAWPLAADAVGTLDLPIPFGKVALVEGTSDLDCGAGQVPCSGIQLARVLDLLGYDDPDSMYEGAIPAPELGVDTAAIRAGAGCTDSDDNGSDFSAGPPSPRNTGSARNACVDIPLQGRGRLEPRHVNVGRTSLLTVEVLAASNPASTGIAVRADLRPVGGSATQALRDDGSQGDLVGGDGIYSFAVPVPTGTTSGEKSLAFSIVDGQARSAQGDAVLTVTTSVAIHAIQGAGRVSPLLGSHVDTTGIVTAVTRDGFFVQSAAGEADANAATSQGLHVFTAKAPPAAAAVGNRVQVSGRVIEQTSASVAHAMSQTAITEASVTRVSGGHALPAPVTLTTQLAGPGSAIDALERLEGMRVTVPSLTVTGPVDGLRDETTASSQATGEFYGVLSSVPRPFREPGINALDLTPIPPGLTPPRFDSNPERLRVASAGQTGAVAMAVDTGATVTGLLGVLGYDVDTYTLLPDPGAATSTTGGALPRAVTVPAANEVSIAHLNLRRLYDDMNNAGDDPVLDMEAYERRLSKTALAICAFLHAPDIISVSDVENLVTLQDLATKVHQQRVGPCQTYPNYTALVPTGSDPSGLNTGYLVKQARISFKPRVEIEQLLPQGSSELFANPDGSTQPLFDRPPVLLVAAVNTDNGGRYRFSVLASHLHPLEGIDSLTPGSSGWQTRGAQIRSRRSAQARFLAGFLQARQSSLPDEKIVVTGDFNAHGFSDGFVDVMGIVSGREVPAGSVLVHVGSPVDQPLTNLTLGLPASERYTEVARGQAQALSHMLVNQALLNDLPGIRVEHARLNADFGIDNFGDGAIPVRYADEDPAVLYLTGAGHEADLELLLYPAVEPTYAGGTLFLDGEVWNRGPNPATDVVVRVHVNMPAGTVQPEFESLVNCTVVAEDADGTTHECHFASLMPGTHRFTFTAGSQLSDVDRNLIVSATVESAGQDPDPDNNAASWSTTLQRPETNLDVSVYEQATVAEFDTAHVEYVMQNNGNMGAIDPRVEFTISGGKVKAAARAPAGWACSEAVPEGPQFRITCQFSGMMPMGVPEPMYLDITSGRPALITTTATISAPGMNDPEPSNNSAYYRINIMRRTTQ